MELALNSYVQSVVQKENQIKYENLTRNRYSCL